jgi:hypothetical protein
LITDGQILRFDARSDKWTLGGGDIQANIDLGRAEYVKIDGGAGGFILETDGAGNLSFSPKGYAYSKLASVSKSSPAIVATLTEHHFINSAPVTFSDIAGLGNLTAQTGTLATSNISATVSGTGTSFSNTFIGQSVYTSSNVYLGVVAAVPSPTTLTLVANATQTLSSTAFKTLQSPLNGNTFYVKVIDGKTFSVYSDSQLATPYSTASLQQAYDGQGQAIANVLPNTTGSGSAGSNYQIQYAFNGILATSPTLTYSAAGVLSATKFKGDGSQLTDLPSANLVGVVASAQSAVNAQNANVAQTVSAPVQANITQTGTLQRLTVANVISAQGATLSGPVTIAGVSTQATSDVVVTKTGEANAATFGRGATIKLETDPTLYAGNNVVGLTAVKNDLMFWSNTNGAMTKNATLSGQNGDLVVRGNLTVGNTIFGKISLANSVSACAQPNITSLGTLTSLAVTGQSTLDNLTVNGTTAVNYLTASQETKVKSLEVGGPLFASNANITLRHVSSTDTYAIRHTDAISFYKNTSKIAEFGPNGLSVTKVLTSSESQFSTGTFEDPDPNKEYGIKVSDGIATSAIVVQGGSSLVIGATNYGQYNAIGLNAGMYSKMMIRNDGIHTYILHSDPSSSLETTRNSGWNAKRPFYIENATGAVFIGGGASTYLLSTLNTTNVAPSVTGAYSCGSYEKQWSSVYSNGFRARSGWPDSADLPYYGYAFNQNGDTGMFADSGVNSWAGNSLFFRIDSQSKLRISSDQVEVYPTTPAANGGALKVNGGIVTNERLQAQGVGVTGSIDVGGEVRGYLNGVARYATRLEKVPKLNGTPFDGYSDLTLQPYYFTTGSLVMMNVVTQVNGDVASWFESYNRVYPPPGFTMADLVQFSAMMSMYAPSGIVNGDDRIRIRWTPLNNECVQVQAYGSEVRAPMEVIYNAVWLRR